MGEVDTSARRIPLLQWTRRRTLDRSLVLCLEDFSGAGELRYGKRAVVHCEADDDADEAKDQAPSRGKE